MERTYNFDSYHFKFVFFIFNRYLVLVNARHSNILRLNKVLFILTHYHSCFWKMFSTDTNCATFLFYTNGSLHTNHWKYGTLSSVPLNLWHSLECLPSYVLHFSNCNLSTCHFQPVTWKCQLTTIGVRQVGYSNSWGNGGIRELRHRPICRVNELPNWGEG